MQTKNLTRLFGNMPKKPEHLCVSVEKIERTDNYDKSILTFCAYCERAVVEFTVKAYIPRDKAPRSVLIRITDGFSEDYGFEDDGSALLVISSEDFFMDGKLTEKAGLLLYRKKQRGYLPLLAWAAIRVFEYAKSLGYEAECVFIEAKNELYMAALLACHLESELVMLESKGENIKVAKTQLECEKELEELSKANKGSQKG